MAGSPDVLDMLAVLSDEADDEPDKEDDSGRGWLAGWLAGSQTKIRRRGTLA